MAAAAAPCQLLPGPRNVVARRMAGGPLTDRTALAERLPLGTRVRLASGRKGTLVACGFTWAVIRYDGGALDHVAPLAELEVIAWPGEARGQDQHHLTLPRVVPVDRDDLPEREPPAPVTDSPGNAPGRTPGPPRSRNTGETKGARPTPHRNAAQARGFANGTALCEDGCGRPRSPHGRFASNACRQRAYRRRHRERSATTPREGAS